MVSIAVAPERNEIKCNGYRRLEKHVNEPNLGLSSISHVFVVSGPVKPSKFGIKWRCWVWDLSHGTGNLSNLAMQKPFGIWCR